MFDTMTMTKVLGGACGSLLVFLLGGWAAELIYESSDSDYEGESVQGYSIPVEDEGGSDEPVEEGPPFEEIYAMADATEGEGLFRSCRSCHMLEPGANGTGPTLYGVVNRQVASVDGFNYSGALIAVADVWDPAQLNGFLENPRGYAPGTAMSYNGMRSVEDRANLIAYLSTIGS